MNATILKFFLIFLRVSPIVAMSPAFGGRLIPSHLKLVLSLLLSGFFMPFLDTTDDLSLFSMAAVQLLMGCIIAVVASLPFAAIQSVGEWIDMHRGETLSQLFLPQLQSRGGTTSRLFLITATTLFFTSGSHHLLVREILSSFSIVPLDCTVGQLVNGETHQLIILELSEGINYLLKSSVRIGIPIVFILWLTDVILGLLNRLAPSLQVFYLGIPVKMWLGIVVLAVGSRWLISEFENLLSEITVFVT